MTADRAFRGERVLVVADGDVDDAVLVAQAALASYVIAADGGAARALAAGVLPDLVIGDGDSLHADERARIEALGATIRDADPHKDESDTELCLLAAVDGGAAAVALVGAFGGPRPEHAVANLLLLADPRFDGVALELFTGAARMTRMGSSHDGARLGIKGRRGDWVSLLAFAGDVEGVRTTGLRYPLDGERLTTGPARGLSNELLDTTAVITTGRGRLLVVHTPSHAESTTGEHT